MLFNSIDMLHVKEIIIDADNLFRQMYHNRQAPYLLWIDEEPNVIHESPGLIIEIPLYKVGASAVPYKISYIKFRYNRDKDSQELTNILLKDIQKAITLYEQKVVRS